MPCLLSWVSKEATNRKDVTRYFIPCGAQHQASHDTGSTLPALQQRHTGARYVPPPTGAFHVTALLWVETQGQGRHTYLIICGTVTLEFSSNTMVMRPLHRMLSTHCEVKQKLLQSPGKPNVHGPKSSSEPFLSLPLSTSCEDYTPLNL